MTLRRSRQCCAPSLIRPTGPLVTPHASTSNCFHERKFPSRSSFGIQAARGCSAALVLSVVALMVASDLEIELAQSPDVQCTLEREPMYVTCGGGIGCRRRIVPCLPMTCRHQPGADRGGRLCLWSGSPVAPATWTGRAESLGIQASEARRLGQFVVRGRLAWRSP